jgi:hypothetical protein
VTALTLNRLAQREIEAVINNVIGNKPIHVSVRQDIIERTDGIPLFVEEMTKAVLEAGSEGAAQHTVASFPSPALAVRSPARRASRLRCPTALAPAAGPPMRQSPRPAGALRSALRAETHQRRPQAQGRRRDGRPRVERADTSPPSPRS